MRISLKELRAKLNNLRINIAYLIMRSVLLKINVFILTRATGTPISWNISVL